VLFERCGLENIRHEATAQVVRGGSPWARWWQETLEAIRGWEQGEHGLTEAREEEYKALTAPGPIRRFGSSTHLSMSAGANVQGTNQRYREVSPHELEFGWRAMGQNSAANATEVWNRR
jgi:hypothetical protein